MYGSGPSWSELIDGRARYGIYLAKLVRRELCVTGLWDLELRVTNEARNLTVMFQ